MNDFRGVNVLRMAATALVILAAGAEEMEAVITIDVLRRGGVQVLFPCSLQSL